MKWARAWSRSRRGPTPRARSWDGRGCGAGLRRGADRRMPKWWRALKTWSHLSIRLGWLRLRVLLDTLYLRFFARPRQRPAPIDIPFHFNTFVRRYGGEVCDDTNQPRNDQPEIADYVFRSTNVIAELKSFEIDPFDPRRDPTRLFKELQKSGMTDDKILEWIQKKGATLRCSCVAFSHHFSTAY